MSEQSNANATSGDDEGDDPGRARLTTAEYLRLTVFNRVSLLGIGLAVVGAVVVALTSPTGPLAVVSPALGGGLLLGGVLLFAIGFSLGQRTLGEREDW